MLVDPLSLLTTNMFRHSPPLSTMIGKHKKIDKVLNYFPQWSHGMGKISFINAHIFIHILVGILALGKVVKLLRNNNLFIWRWYPVYQIRHRQHQSLFIILLFTVNSHTKTTKKIPSRHWKLCSQSIPTLYSEKIGWLLERF